MVTVVTASSGIDSYALTGFERDSSVILGSTSVRTSATYERDQDEDGEEAKAREDQQQQAAALTWVHRN